MSEFEKVDLPSGGWAVLRDPETITQRQRRPLDRLQMRVGFDSDVQALLRWQLRVRREFETAQKDAADRGVEFDVESFEPSSTAPVRQDVLTDDQLDLLGSLVETATVMLIESWSHEQPVTVDGLEDLPPKDYTALVEAAGKYRDQLMPSFDVDPAPESPTEPSGESETS